MPFWKRRDYHEEYDERYARRPVRERRDQPIVWVHLLTLAVIGAAALFVVWGLSGLAMLERSLKLLAAPLGLCWLVLLGGTWFAVVWRRAGAALLLGFAALSVTVAGNRSVATLLASRLESPWLQATGQNAQTDAAATGPFDAVIVLGGGTSAGPDWKPQLGGAGDRIMRAIALWHSGGTRRLIVTGEQTFRSDPNDPEPAEEARDLLRTAGVPADAIVALRGANTRAELANVRTWLDQLPDAERPRRVGLLTSAWHLNRAMRVAGEAGLKDLVPVPADWFSEPWTPDPSIVIPSASNLQQTTTLLHELLAQWLGR